MFLWTFTLSKLTGAHLGILYVVKVEMFIMEASCLIIRLSHVVMK